MINTKYFGEQWRRYKDTDYFCSNYGRIKRVYKKTEHINSIFYVEKHHSHKVKMDGKERSPHRIIYECWYGDIPEGYCVYHKNFVKSDNSINNLALIKREQLGKLTGKRAKRDRPLILDVETGKIYKSTREAEQDLFLSRQTISDYCHGKVKNPIRQLKFVSRERI